MHLSSVCEYRDAEGNKLFKALEESKSTYEDMKINTDALNIMKSGDYVAPADKHVSFSPEPEVKGKYYESNLNNHLKPKICLCLNHAVLASKVSIIQGISQYNLAYTELWNHLCNQQLEKNRIAKNVMATSFIEKYTYSVFLTSNNWNSIMCVQYDTLLYIFIKHLTLYLQC